MRHVADLWTVLARHQPGAPASIPKGMLPTLHRIWGLLGPAEWLMQTGGDARLVVDPRTGLNGYGCSHRPRPWAVTFASSTASSGSERGYDGAEAMRQRLLRHLLGDTDVVADALEDVRREITRQYALRDGNAVVLAASGTDCELFAVAAAQCHPGGRPLTAILTAPEEPGAGSRWRRQDATSPPTAPRALRSRTARWSRASAMTRRWRR